MGSADPALTEDGTALVTPGILGNKPGCSSG